MPPTPPITPCLWFDTQAQEAAEFYTSLFDNSRITAICTYPEATEAVSGKPKGSVMTVSFELQGQPYLALNGGPMFSFSEAVSLIVYGSTQAEIDRYWDALTDGGQASHCGWLKDRFGMSWQVVPTELIEWTNHPDAEVRERVMGKLLTMTKLEIEPLRQAAQGTTVTST